MKVKLEEDGCFGNMFDENEVDCQICIDADECRKAMKKAKTTKAKKLEAKPKKEKKIKEKNIVKNLLSVPKILLKDELKELHGRYLDFLSDTEISKKKEIKPKASLTLVGNRKRTLSGYMDYLGLTGKYTIDEMVQKLSIYNKVKNTKGDLKRRLLNHFKFIEANRPLVDRVEINNGVYKIVVK